MDRVYCSPRIRANLKTTHGSNGMTRLRAERLQRGMGLQDIGFHVRMSASDISKIECGRLKPYPSQAQRLADFFGLKAEEMLEEVGISGHGSVASPAVGCPIS